VILLHGGAQNGARALKQSGWGKLAVSKGFVLIVPDAIDQSWNDGRTDYFRPGSPPRLQDDVGFLSVLIDRAVRDHGGDRNRVAMTGSSNGGNMVFRFACEQGTKLRAIAPIIASLQQKVADSCRAPSPLAVMMIAGTADPLVPWEGGTSSVASRKRGVTFGARLSIPDSTDYWARINGCDPAPQERTLPNVNRSDDITITELRYVGCRRGGDTLLLRVNGGGHQMPRLQSTFSRPRLVERIVGKQGRDIDGDAAVWNFFERVMG
jgi:polyhydroxybutyrate depolymerase